MRTRRPGLGLILRLLGPLVEGGCVLGLLNHARQGRTILGVAVEPILYAGLGLGVVLVMVGLFLSPQAGPTPRRGGLNAWSWI